MKQKSWKFLIGGDCPNCGNDIEVYTMSNEEGFGYDGESVRCIECLLSGCISVDEDEQIGIIWNDE